MRMPRLDKRTCGFAAALSLGATIVVFLLWPREPTYEHKPFSYWIDQLPSVNIGADGRSESIHLPGSYRTKEEAIADQDRRTGSLRQAHKTLDTIGTNHLSTLIARLQEKDSRVMATVRDWAERLRIVDVSFDRSAYFRRGQALSAFVYLRSRARPVVPQLLDLTKNQDTNTQLLAWFALEAVAPDEFHKRKHPPIIQHDYGTR